MTRARRGVSRGRSACSRSATRTEDNASDLGVLDHDPLDRPPHLPRPGKEAAPPRRVATAPETRARQPDSAPGAPRGTRRPLSGRHRRPRRPRRGIYSGVELAVVTGPLWIQAEWIRSRARLRQHRRPGVLGLLPGDRVLSHRQRQTLPELERHSSVGSGRSSTIDGAIPSRGPTAACGSSSFRASTVDLNDRDITGGKLDNLRADLWPLCGRATFDIVAPCAPHRRVPTGRNQCQGWLFASSSRLSCRRRDHSIHEGQTEAGSLSL